MASAVWDYAEGMTMLRAFWDAALEVDAEAPDEGKTMRWCTPDKREELWTSSGLEEVRTSELVVEAEYASFDDHWGPFLAGVGPSGAFCVALDEAGATSSERHASGGSARQQCPSRSAPAPGSSAAAPRRGRAPARGRRPSRRG